MTATQKQTAEAIVNIFETGAVCGKYGQITVAAGDKGHLTFGRSQTTLASGNLHTLIDGYCARAGAQFAARLKSYLPRLASHDLTLDHEQKLHNILRASADDAVMRDTQDEFFDTVYWQPAARSAEREGLHTPLGVAVRYDAQVHGSWDKVRNLTRKKVGDVASIGEQRWIAAYVETRRAWLASSTNALLRQTVYRMDAFKRLIDQGRWALELPLVVRGLEISVATLAATPPDCFSGPQPGTRPLAVTSPLPSGLDVRLVQLGLSDHGADIIADGVFGRASSRCIREYQATNNLPVTGVADIPLIAQLASECYT